MRKVIAWAFMYSLDGLLADEGTVYWQFCFGLPVEPAEVDVVGPDPVSSPNQLQLEWDAPDPTTR